MLNQTAPTFPTPREQKKKKKNEKSKSLHGAISFPSSSSWCRSASRPRTSPPSDGCAPRGGQSPTLPPLAAFFRPGGTPILATVHDDFCTFFDPIQNAALRVTDLPELTESRLHAAGAGDWLLLSRGRWEVFFFNVSARVTVRLPDLDMFSAAVACFSGAPDSPGCTVITASHSMLEIHVLKRGKSAWTFREFEHKRSYTANCAPVTLGESCYFLRSKGHAVGFNHEEWEDVDDDDYYYYDVYVDRPEPLRKWRSGGIDQCYLAEDGGELLAVILGYIETRVSVFRLDLRAGTWRKVDRLENKMMFVSQGSSLVVDATVPGAGNKIYLPKSRGGRGIFYSLATNRFHTFLDDFPLRRSEFIKDVKPSYAWIQVPAEARNIRPFTW
ncbi:hypothetical protein EUGRSUZ_F01628 [Eucalyptus grandis]|uniref:Uncharacterized protein n=2 Tax=Eucalyptus grandis TaxID=71139 RepID=A0ACC3KH62_EUCGR|nr:hypothetical protein EUGRSUZ_F01628 [Eucalyptus grandis]